MSLRGVIAAAVDSAWIALGDIPSAVTLRRITSAYNPATGQMTPTTTDYTIAQAILTKYESFEIDKVTTLATDRKMIIRKKDVSVLVNVTTDRVVVGSTIYSIIRVYEDPAGATYTLQLRQA